MNNTTRYDHTVLHPAIMNGLSDDVLNTMLADIDDYAADDLDMLGVEALEECQSIMDETPRHMMFYVLFERDMEDYEDVMFLKLIDKLIAHASKEEK